MGARKPNFDLLLKKARPQWIEESDRLLDREKIHI
jgi:hypothetical protein